MATGTIKKLVSDKGFGFISPSSGGNDIFFHLSALQDIQFNTLQIGQNVSYDVDDGNDRGKGPRAMNVRVDG